MRRKQKIKKKGKNDKKNCNVQIRRKHDSGMI